MSKRIFTSAGVIQRENLTSASGSSSSIAASSCSSRIAAAPVGRVAVALLGVHGAAREHPDAAHEARLGRALDEQQLERLAAAAQQDHASRPAAARAGGPVFSSSPGPGRSLSGAALIG